MSKGDKEFHEKAVELAPIEPQTLVKVVEYNSNNSGGDWWLSDDDWYALERAGWEIRWYADEDDTSGGRYGALASHATRVGLSLEDAISEWEEITGQNADDVGCECCGTPHWFDETEEWR